MRPSNRTPRSRTRLAAIGAAVLVSATAACSAFGTTGSGPVKTETREVGTFTKVEVSAGIGIDIQIGSAGPLTISAEENILPLILTHLVGDTLLIHSSASFLSPAGVDVTIPMATLDGLSMDGGSQGTVGTFDGQALSVELSGGSAVTVTGSVDTLDLGASGGSRASLDGLTATTVAVDLSGGSNVTVRASGTVTGSASGGSHLTVLGEASMDVSTTGGSEVTHG